MYGNDGQHTLRTPICKYMHVHTDFGAMFNLSFNNDCMNLIIHVAFEQDSSYNVITL